LIDSVITCAANYRSQLYVAGLLYENEKPTLNLLIFSRRN